MMPFYIYRHIRPDTNEVFYIGKGNNLDKRKSLYRRANEVIKRSEFWKRVYSINNCKIEVDIIFECSTHEEANRKEVEFISLYGRKDLRMGSLVNMSNGGDGSLGLVYTDKMRAVKMAQKPPMLGKKHSKSTKEKLSKRAKQRVGNPFLGKKHTKDTIAILSELAKNRTPSNTRKVIDTKTNTVYPKVKDAASAFGINYSNLCELLKGNRVNNTTLKYL